MPGRGRFKGLTLGQQTLNLAISNETTDRFDVIVPPPVVGGIFSWTGGTFALNGRGSGGATTGDLPLPAVIIPIRFNPPSFAAVMGEVTINVIQPGVGPATLKITHVEANPVGDDLPEEFVEIVNISTQPVDLRNCMLGDFTFQTGPDTGIIRSSTKRPLIRIDVP